MVRSSCTRDRLSGMERSTYVIAAGSNRRGRHGTPPAEIAAALEHIKGRVTAAAIRSSAPMGPSTRRFANTVALVETRARPEKLLRRLKRIERRFGRRPGQRWGARVIDLDIILWSGGAFEGPGLTIPHPAFRERDFVLTPLLDLAADWRDPISGFTVRQLHSRLTRRRPLPSRSGAGAGP
ncbi:2-amino-4-hydroxy-6-hydroxymethyldihydropteridine diphosphokinase [Sphingomonas sp. 179-I 2A4 NHS]|uniref:2-amino-4-hydroxy-6- hydroxymethyldihydropteridine diphosphokinase n=2 Tax=Sphingomonas TaxID=13687 RepID=UPI003879D675